MSRVLAGEDDGLITTDTGGAINRMRLASAKLKIVFRPKNKVGQCLVEMIEPRKVDIAAIHDNKASRFWNDTIQHC